MDLIDRQQVIEILATMQGLCTSKAALAQNSKIWQQIKDLPSAEPKQRWIPLKTALPEKGQYVLCQCRAGIMDVLRLTDDNGWYKDSTHIYMHAFVLAWMPLPEPYSKDGEADG